MKIVGFPLAVVVFLAVWFVPLVGMDEITRHTLALMFFTIVLWITRPWMPALTGMLFMVLAWLFGLADREVALSGFSSSTPWFIWGALMLALAVRETKLDVRLAYTLLKKLPASSKGLIALHYLISWLLSYVIPSATARVATLAPVAASQIESLGLPRKSNTGKMLMISLVLVNWMAAQSLMTGGSTPLTAWGILQESGIYVSWVQWWSYQIVPLFVMMSVLFMGCSFLFRPEPAPMGQGTEGETGDGKDTAQLADEVLAALGPISSREKKLAAMMLSVLLLWATEIWHGIATDLIGIMAGILVLLPGIGVLKAREAFRKVGWHTVLFVAAALSIGNVTQETGVAQWLGSVLRVLLNVGNSQIMFFLMMVLVGSLARLLLRSGAAAAAVLLLPTIRLAESMGYNPTLVGVLFPLCMAGMFIYQHAYGLIAHDYGTFEEPDFILACLVRYVALIAGILVGYYIWWPLLGLL